MYKPLNKISAYLKRSFTNKYLSCRCLYHALCLHHALHYHNETFVQDIVSLIYTKNNGRSAITLKKKCNYKKYLRQNT